MSTSDHKDIVKYNPIKGYEILNRIQPKYFQTEYPYNLWNNAKLIFTQKKIELLVSKQENLKSPDSKSKKLKKDQPNKKDKKLGGSNDDLKLKHIIIYG